MDFFTALFLLLLVVTALLAAALYFVIKWLNAEINPCVKTPKDEAQAKRLAAFSLTYHEARKKFRTAAKKIEGAKLSSHLVTMDEATGLELTIDICVIPGGTDRHVMVHLCGTHGVEGYAGSAVQIAFLERLAAENGGKLKPATKKQPTLIFIHSVNPYGMFADRRFNENNVDLNRNCIADDSPLWSQLLAREPNAYGYEQFRALFTPAVPPGAPVPTSLWDMMLFLPRFLPHILKHGIPKLKRTFVTGQYHHPEGLYYGGRGMQRNWLLIREFLTPYLAKANIAVGIDVHSGLGPSGVDTMMSTARCYELCKEIWGKGNCVIDHPAMGGADASAGYDDAKGFSDLSELCAGRTKEDFETIVCITEEFGTRSPVRVASGVMLENIANSNAKNSPAHRLARLFSRGAFVVETQEWKESVLRRGLERLEHTVKWFETRKL